MRSISSSSRFALTAIAQGVRQARQADRAVDHADADVPAGRRVHLRADGRPVRPATAADDRPGLLLGRRSATGFAHNYTTFLVLRALFGIGMGGEWGVGASLAMEKVPPRIGAASSPGCCRRAMRPATCWRRSATSSCSRAGDGGRCSSSAAARRCWRSSCGSNVKESKCGSGRERIATGRRSARRSSRTGSCSSISFVLMAMMNFVSHGTQDMYPTFLKRDWGFTPQQRRASSR